MDNSLWEKLSQSVNNAVISKFISITVILILAYLAIRVSSILLKRWQKMAEKKLKDSPQTIYAMETRFSIIKRIISVSIYFFILMLILLQFDAVRTIGLGLLASAGLASIVLGLAAQNTLSNIIAGVSM